MTLDFWFSRSNDLLISKSAHQYHQKLLCSDAEEKMNFQSIVQMPLNQQLDQLFDLSTINKAYITGKLYGFIKNNNTAALVEHIKSAHFTHPDEANIFVIAVAPQSDCKFLDECVAYQEDGDNEITFEDEQYYVTINCCLEHGELRV